MGIKIKEPETKGFKGKIIEEHHVLADCTGIYLKYALENIFLSSSGKNRWILTKCENIIKIIDFTSYKNEDFIYGCALRNKMDFYKTLIVSSKLLTIISL